MIGKGVSTIVAARDAVLRPSIMRAMGSTISDDGGHITVYLARSQARQLLLDIAATGFVAVVFSEPFSHQTVQVKSGKVRTRSAVEADRPVLARYLASMQEEIARIGFPPELARVMLAHRLEDLVAVELEPEVAFDQTPGPKAGSPLSAGAEA